MRIIPAIDIIDGKCVRLSKGDYDTKKIYNENPVEVAKEFEANGIKYLHLVDLDGAKSGKIINAAVLENIAKNTNLIIDFGGGIKSDEAIETAFNAGANQITIGSVAVADQEKCISWIAKYGAEKIILGADCLDRKIKTSGWLESSDLDVIDFIKNYKNLGLNDVICTDISKDGMLEGASNELYKEILSHVEINLIASGGVSNIEDLEQLKIIGCSGAIVGKAFYEGKITFKDLQKFL
ncbi:1-(5-phosphoribosyl)-5-[(5-phosphoribosylamino)methylideneamino]imidazole-4-carboxamide isomerase [Halpernia frigidisoli]|uniref:1-(5-phosphoribosyl)-5-[(5-phosphoribosylamino)methylideneamino] imidazole-4-carboxamide isomerase n=1 Tax=Halpernia frigidisoli TaxID=1125876 RepID=A0A1I3CV55_9FLAO|nr:1-(5-phosphoribosyl)-5-[(5-phosphoribosylamino)methylideneamino]imidazole-4-carboxamide isomerase [Halpernia frigidisoli]SFH78313.1 1-(5-phosphoribosyl)-5-[(5-phosphoribosylamino)methylideneamino] imidazole-4-carboxamide isomerase [Halpernia frigidisoli]